MSVLMISSPSPGARSSNQPEPIVQSVARSKEWGKRYELLTCAWKGHFLVGGDAAEVGPDDAALAREGNGIRWCRCLRCDAWIPVQPPEHPARQRIPSRDDIELPPRGPVLRDRYVLRLIAIDRAIHVVVLVTLAGVLFAFAGHTGVLRRDYVNVMNDLSGGDPGSSQLRGVLGYLRRAFQYTPTHLVHLGLVVLAYAALEATEMVGLWLAKRWAEYLTLVATSIFVPIEIYELTLGVSVFKVVTLVINLAIVCYLLLAKRLFGLRGGIRVEMERRRELSGWTAIDRETPSVPTAVP
jgi:uncharacterized membrane protein (DUF2068 family)